MGSLPPSLTQCLLRMLLFYITASFLARCLPAWFCGPCPNVLEMFLMLPSVVPSHNMRNR